MQRGAIRASGGTEEGAAQARERFRGARRMAGLRSRAVDQQPVERSGGVCSVKMKTKIKNIFEN